MSTIVTRIYEPCHKVTAACDGKSNTAVYLDAIAPPTTKTASANSEAVFILPAGDAYPAPNNGRLLARRDLPRPHAELVDVTVADDHLDGGCHRLTSTRTLGVALPLNSQVLD
jgi:hypothetical protein